MPKTRREKLVKGFTLIELLIVIIIISLVYYLGFSGMENIKSKPKALTPVNLKSSIVNAELFSGEATLLCIDNCKTCYLRKDISSPFEAYENTIDLKGLQVYTLDSRDSLQRVEYGRYQDEKVCLSMHFYPNGSSSQVILKQKDKVYFLPAYFGEPARFDSLEDAKAYWLQNTQAVANSGDFY